MANPPFDKFFAEHRQRLEALHGASGAARWSVPLEDFAQAAWLAVAKPAASEPKQVPQLLQNLRSEDLALALGCAQGNERAWDTFCAEYRAVLYEAAYAFAGEESQARELADSLLPELYGVDSPEGPRRSKFAYFYGRSSLKTWLHSVLHHKFVNEYRRQSKLEPLPEEPSEVAGGERALSEPEEARYAKCLREAVEAVLGELAPGEKLLLGYYYLQGLTLKQIGRLTGEHEATISRHLASVTQKLRKRIEGYLRRVEKLSAFEVERCLDFASRGVSVNLERVLKPE
jgi:RNA polymerase sigma-70 factor